ncbi:MBL fold metallo-hydrolase [Massilia dura]|uniref:MBL fold metallo-hydrolase n=1 Tax=Pseudoduganella dura TaxID=321982 RepID=A0A6I3XSG2_9BURK|nr:MBL fold metallo-hydrolase [Pseudoduganella dura]MUI15408.1 MBL fold metallo-hydrolase [Pseudoduganella dura]
MHVRNAAIATALAATVGTAAAQTVNFQQIRNATIKVEYAGTTFLVDPMLAPRGAWPGFEGTVNSHLRNPLVDLPVPLADVLKADAVIVTHTHLDHWDDAARQALPKTMPVFAQNDEDAAGIRKDGFTDVRVLGEDTMFNGIRLAKTGGRHGTDAMMATALGKRLGTVSGIVFRRAGFKTTYIAGDTTWTADVEQAITAYRPDIIVLNTGYARIQGVEGSIIMGKEDLVRAARLAPAARVVGIHMEAVNHATQTRRELRDFAAGNGIGARVLVPEDGEKFGY